MRSYTLARAMRIAVVRVHPQSFPTNTPRATTHLCSPHEGFHHIPITREFKVRAGYTVSSAAAAGAIFLMLRNGGMNIRQRPSGEHAVGILQIPSGRSGVATVKCCQSRSVCGNRSPTHIGKTPPASARPIGLARIAHQMGRRNIAFLASIFLFQTPLC